MPSKDEESRAARMTFTDETTTGPFKTERGEMGDYFWPTQEDIAEGRFTAAQRSKPPRREG